MVLIILRSTGGRERDTSCVKSQSVQRGRDAAVEFKFYEEKKDKQRMEGNNV